jgi:uncharacterized protein DUF4193
MAKDLDTEEGDSELGELDELVEIDESEIDAELADDELDVEDVAVLADADDDEDDVAIVEEDEEAEADTEEAEAVKGRVVETEDDDIEIVSEDDVEESLDEILKSRMVVEDEPEDEEGVDVEDRTEKPDTVLPKQADEFRCSNCFLIKKTSQLADARRQLCRDCV